MKKLVVALIAVMFCLSAAPANALVVYMVGDNDGYGYGNGVVPDGADLPATGPPPGCWWCFDNRSAGELAAVDGSQHTDFEPYAARAFSFTIGPTISGITSATFTLDVSGIQPWWGASSISLDGVDFSFMLPYDQGALGSGVFSAAVPVSLLADGFLNVDFTGGPAGDHIAFDYFSLAVVPEPGTLLLLGSGLLGLGYIGRKRIKG